MMEELLENEEFLKKLEETESITQAAALLHEYGVEITEEELLELAQSGNEELTEDDLEAVAGGGVIGIIIIKTILNAIKQQTRNLLPMPKVKKSLLKK